MEDFKNIIGKIVANFPNDYRSGSFGSEKPTYKAFYELRDWVADQVIKDRQHLKISFSVGKGNWTQVPHLSIMNSNEANDTRDGFYIVVLFKHSMDGFYLCFGQGVTGPSNHYGKRGGEEYLVEKANQARPFFDNLKEKGFSFNAEEMQLEATGGVALGYGPGICLHKLFMKNDLPNDISITNHFNELIDCYDKLLENNVSSNLKHIFSERNFWIIATGENAKYWDHFKNANVISIGWQTGNLARFKTKKDISAKIKEIDPYNTAEPVNSALCCFEFANSMKVGDIVFCKHGTKSLLGAGEVNGDYVYQEDDNHPHIREMNWLNLAELDVQDYAGIKAPLKTLTNITRYSDYVEQLSNFYLNSDVDEVDGEFTSIKTGLLEDTFFNPKKFHEITSVLLEKKNIIIQGPPGVGKTFIASKISDFISDGRDKQLNLVFHENYSYEEFIMGIRPDGDGKFSLMEGQFLEFCSKAKSDPENKYALLIDEINRANITKVFGEILVLIEDSKRGKEHSVKLLYSTDQEFYIPQNLYIIGLMNTADRSLKVVDYALRRRFSFFTFSPEFSNPDFKKFLIERNVNSAVADKLISNMEKINQKISDETLDLGPGYCIGHSFFCPLTGSEKLGNEWYNKIITNQIIPLLEEYYFDRPEKVDELRTELLS